jgi:predicted ester cyclase
MSDAAQTNKKRIERLYEDCLNPGRLELIGELVDDFVGGRGERGPEGFKQTVTAVKAAFPDAHFTIEDLVAEGDRVVARWRMKGTHRGPFAGFPASGQADFARRDRHLSIQGSENRPRLVAA